MKKLYDFFSSVKLAIFLLLVLATTSIIGTIIEQQKDPVQYLKEYGETTYRIFKFLGFTDVYHSWWYVLLLVLLAVNLIVCSIKRLPKIWKIAMKPKKILPEGQEKNLKAYHSITFPVSAEKLKSTLIEAFQKARYKVELVKEEEGRIYLFGDKNVFARFGVYIVHFGVLTVLIGGLVTAIWGYRGYMNLAQGTSSNLVSFFNEGKIIELPFYVKCNKFKIDFYPSGMPKAYVSDLSIIEDGKEVMRKRIKVNDPLKYKGIYFYQASYGQGEAFVQLKRGNDISVVAVAFGQPFKIENGVYMRIVSVDGIRMVVGFEIIDHGKVTGYQAKMFTPYRVPGTDVLFAVADIKPVFYTGIQVSKDPGTWIVWLGSVILIGGLIVAFFIPHRRVWVKVEKKGEEKTRLVIGGTTNKGTEGLVQELDGVLGVLKSLYCQNTPKEERDG